MVRKCILCNASDRKHSLLTFHRFPSNLSVRMQWLKACNLSEKDVVKNTFLCSNHFLEDDYDDTYWPKRMLKKNVVPSPTIKIINPRDLQSIANSQSAQNNQESNKETIQVAHCSRSMTPISRSRSVTPPSHSRSMMATSLCTGENSENPRYVGDLTVNHFSTPRKAKRHLSLVENTVETQRKKIKILQQQKRVLENCIDNFKNLLTLLRENKLLTEEASTVIEDNMPDIVRSILDRQLQSKNAKYSAELRCFALTLHFYSPKAYSYVRERFMNFLPHSNTMQKWYGVLNCKPGFTKEAFDALKLKAEEDVNKKVIINICLDEMSIRQLIQWDGQKYHGFIDFGTAMNVNGWNNIEAKNVLVFMAVSMNSHWKVPLGYFLITSLNGPEKANLMKTCFHLLEDTGAICYSITFDGATTNISAAVELGASFSLNNFKPWFENPVTKEKVFVFWDACHMIKLVRNTFGDKKVICNPNGVIKWKYLEELHNIQCKEGLHAANKLTSRHIYFQNEKMSVKLAVQTLSASVSSALIFSKNIYPQQFQDVDATAEFCLIMNNIFDMLNSRNIFCKYRFNEKLCYKNYAFFRSTTMKYIDYIKTLKFPKEWLIIESNRKTGFIGLVVCLTNTLNVFEELVINKNFMLYILSYKFCQDHLEMFFSAIRSCGGFNNNPSALQFQSAYKRLLIRHQIASSKNSNCSVLDATSILFVGSGFSSRTCNTISEDNNSAEDLTEHDHDYFYSLMHLTPFVEDIVKYISGFVIKKVLKKINCTICISQLHIKNSISTLLEIKNRGKLILPSKDVCSICILTEKYIRKYKSILFSRKNVKHFLELKVLRDSSDAFNNSIMINHIKGQQVLDNHRIQLIKFLTNFYIDIRLHYEAKIIKNTKCRIREKYTKLILFENQ